MKNLKRYFSRPSVPWIGIYFLGGMVFGPLAFGLWAVTLGCFRPQRALEDWAAYCFNKDRT